MRTEQGFILFELIVALTIIGSALILFGHWLTLAPTERGQAKWIADTEVLIEATRQYWFATGVAPDSVQQLEAAGFITEIQTPWERSWTFNSTNNQNNRMVALQIQAPSAPDAQWLKTQLPTAVVQHLMVSVMIWQPISEIHAARYLHREARPDAPELNQLATDLDVNGYALSNVGEVSATAVQTEHLDADALVVRNLTGTWLTADTVTTQALNTIDGNYYAFRNQLQNLQQLWDNCVATGGCR